MDLRFECPSCGQHLSATPSQIGVTASCPNCNAAVTVPKTPTLPIMPMDLRFECASCGQHLSATRSQIGVTASCPNCNAAVTVPKTSTLPLPTTSAKTDKIPGKKHHETTVILFETGATGQPKTKKVKISTKDRAQVRNWLINRLSEIYAGKYVGGIFDQRS